jgi:hypothetical protein
MIQCSTQSRCATCKAIETGITDIPVVGTGDEFITHQMERLSEDWGFPLEVISNMLFSAAKGDMEASKAIITKTMEDKWKKHQKTGK